MAIDEIIKERPSYYAIIPAVVRYDTDLTPNTKLMYGEITALANKNGYCNAGNEYFAGLYEVHKMTISKWISQLRSKGYINVDLIYKKGTKSIEERRIIINGIPISEKVDTYKQNEIYPISEKTEDNNTSINTTSNNKEKIYKKEKYYENENLNNLFIEYLELRKKLKAVNSDRAIKTLLNILKDYDDETKSNLIEKSIVNSWKSIYPKNEIKKTDTKLPEWFDKEIKKEEYDEEYIRAREEFVKKVTES